MTLRPSLPTAPAETATWLEPFRRALARADRAPRTIRGYAEDLALFARWYEGDLGARFSPERLTHDDLVNYREHLRGQGRRPATINRHLQALRRLARWARQQGLLAEDPSTELEGVDAGRRLRPRGLRDPEIHRLLRAASSSSRQPVRDSAIVQLLVHTGVRVAELAGMTVGDLVVRDRSGSIRVRHGKGTKEREIPLNASIRRCLRLYLATRSSPKPLESLFESSRGSAMSVRAIQHLVTGLGRRAGIDRPVTAHTLRHAFALNYMRDHPGKLVELQVLLGHESLDTTAIYTRPSQDELAEDLERSHLNVYGGRS